MEFQGRFRVFQRGIQGGEFRGVPGVFQERFIGYLGRSRVL